MLAAIVTRSAGKLKAMSPETAPGTGAQQPKTRGMIAKSPKKTFSARQEPWPDAA